MNRRSWDEKMKIQSVSEVSMRVYNGEDELRVR